MKKPLTILLLLLAIAGLPSLRAQDQPTFVPSGVALEKAAALYDSGSYQQALQLLGSIDRSDTNYVKALYTIGLCYYADSQYDKSIYYNQQALDAATADPEKVPDILNQYGISIDAAGETEKALKFFDSVILRYPAYSLFYLNTGNMLIKLKRYAEAETVLQKGLLINPYSFTTHFKLGIVALHQGKLIPSMLCFIGYLLNNPQGTYHSNCISYLRAIANNADNVQALLTERKEQPSEAYQALEQIVQSKIALDQNYKLIVQPDDPILRQIQVVMEKIQYDPADSDFYMQYYVPLYKRCWDRQQFELFINQAFYSVDVPVLDAFRKKNKKELGAFLDTLGTYFTHIKETRVLNLAGRDMATTFWVHTHGVLTAHGKYLEQEKRRAGVWELYYGAGNIRSRGNYNDQGNEEGWWIYYYFNGDVRAKINYVNGNREDVSTFYFDEGTVSAKEPNRNGQLNGENISYYLVGTPKQSTRYQAGKEDGAKYYFFDNGDISSMETWRNGELNGPGRTWYDNGQVEKVYNYVNGKAEGPYVKYFDNGAIENQGNYVKGEPDGLWKSYYSDGRVHDEQNYSNGKQEGLYKEYSDSGVTIQTMPYRRGKADGEARFTDDDGKPYAIYQYSNGMLQHATYFDKAGKTIDEAVRSQNQILLTSHFPDGGKKMQASFNSNDNESGTKTFYYPSGQVQATEEYKDGKQDGADITYYSDGAKKDESRYSDGKMNGLRTTYAANGKISSQGYYQDNEPCGVWTSYDDLGAKTESKFYSDGVLTGRVTDFWPNGQKHAESVYKRGWLYGLAQFDSSGREFNRISLPAGTGDLTLNYPDGKPFVRGRYVRGKLDGPYKMMYPDGRTQEEETYTKGMMTGEYKVYYHSGKLHTEGQYNYGRKTGVWKYYYSSGKIKSAEEWLDGKQIGKEMQYYEAGELEYSGTYKDNVKSGPVMRFDPDGALMCEVDFRNDIPVGYTYLDKNGVRLPLIPIRGQAAKIKAFYPNGKPSAEMEYKDGMLSGDVKQYFDNGQLKTSYALKAGNLTGPSLTYYKNGRLQFEFSYLNDNVHGPYKEYNDKGILIESGAFYLGQQHGVMTDFDDRGAVTETTVYYYGNIISIK